MKKDWVIIVPESEVIIASQFGINQDAFEFIGCRVRVRILLYDISYSNIKTEREMLDTGEDVRYVDHYDGVFFLVQIRRRA